MCNTRIIEQQDRKKRDVELVDLSFGQRGQTCGQSSSCHVQQLEHSTALVLAKTVPQFAHTLSANSFLHVLGVFDFACELLSAAEAVHAEIISHWHRPQ